MTRLIVSFLLMTVAFSSVSLADEAPPLQIEIRAGDHDRVDTPVRIALPASSKATHYRIGNAVVAVLKEEGKSQLNVVVHAKAGEVLKLTAVPMGQANEKTGSKKTAMQCNVGEQHIDLIRGDQRILRYNRAVVAPPQGAKPSHARSGFIHPVLTPNGRTVTNAFAKGHWHHYGLWFPWRKTIFEEQEVNFWETGNGQGAVRFAKLLSHGSDHYSAWFDVTHEHVALKIKDGPKTVLNETWRVQAFATKRHHLFDVKSTQATATKSPLTIEKYFYGGFGMRGSEHWEGDAVDFLTSEGKTRKDGNFTAARWVSMSGQLDGKLAGITIMGHPSNFRSPQKTRLHPKEPFFCFAPGMDEAFEIKPGKDYVSQFRFVVHDGEVDAKLMEQLWNDYANPPKVVVTAK